MPAKPAEEVENAGAQSLTQIVRKKIEHLILRGEIAPGARLNELAIANRFAVSRSPVREAVRSLEQAGLVAAPALGSCRCRQGGERRRGDQGRENAHQSSSPSNQGECMPYGA